MQLPIRARNVLRWLVATLVVAAVTELLVRLGANQAVAAMTFLVVVVSFAAQTRIELSVYVTLFCGLSFDYFFLPPVGTLRLEGAEAWVAMVSFLFSCLVVARVAERARKQARQADERRAEVDRLYQLSQEMMLQEDATRLLDHLPGMIARIFALEAVVLYLRDLDKLYSSTPDLPLSIPASLRAMTMDQDQTQSLPGDFMARTLMLGLHPVGALGLRPARLSHEAVTAVSAQIAIAIARATAIETSARVEAARKGERLRTALIDSLTHELRTPLTAIRAAATTLLDGGGLDEAARRELTAILDEESARLDGLIDEAVEMAEIDAHAVQLQVLPQHPRALLEQAVEAARGALGAHRVVIAAGDPEETDKPAWFDPHLLGRVLGHLLENAIRYTPPGGRILLRSRRSGGRLEFSVQDDGTGVDAADLPFIFEKFYRGGNGAGKGKGTGMGLAICRAIVAAHGGGIEVESAPERGACFRFWVPLVEGDPGEAASRKEQAE
ncbi:MAG: sensor histidine kinase [Terracidiphilus sp.]